MRLVIDTNRIIAGLIRDGPSRALIFSKNFQFFTPMQALTEIEKYKEELCDKADVSFENFKLILSFLFEKITLVPLENYEEYMEEAKNLLLDKDDAPFLALAFALDADGIWTDDKGFRNQDKMNIITTKDLLSL